MFLGKPTEEIVDLLSILEEYNIRSPRELRVALDGVLDMQKDHRIAKLKRILKVIKNYTEEAL